jgi:hypothetical protein
VWHPMDDELANMVRDLVAGTVGGCAGIVVGHVSRWRGVGVFAEFRRSGVSLAAVAGQRPDASPLDALWLTRV